jgi:serine/threonine protein kinase
MLYLEPLQIGELTEVFKIFKNGRICVTKRSKINNNGFINPRFLREINILKRLSDPPEHLITHPGRLHVIKLLDIYTQSNYLHYDMELIDGTINDLNNKIDLYMIKEQILIDISNALQYIHEIGFNHCDLSNNNIGYCKLSNITNLDTKVFKFVLIDFGNSMHYDRPLTLEIGTIYTLPPEIILAIYILNYINNQPRKIDQYVQILRKLIIHKKSDIWSLGAISYYLHSFKTYTSSKTLESQYIELKTLKPDFTKIKGHKEILSKTSIILCTDHMNRPVTYFSPIYRICKPMICKQMICKPMICKPTICKQMICKPMICKPTICKQTICKPMIYKSMRKKHVIKKISNNYGLYENIITHMSKYNNMIFMINRLDAKSSDNLLYHCYQIDKSMIDYITNKINIGVNLSLLEIIRITRIVLLWLVSHLYMNNVWKIDHIIRYMSKMYNNHVTNNMIINIAFTILQTIEWNFEKFIDNPIK